MVQTHSWWAYNSKVYTREQRYYKSLSLSLDRSSSSSSVPLAMGGWYLCLLICAKALTDDTKQTPNAIATSHRRPSAMQNFIQKLWESSRWAATIPRIRQFIYFLLRLLSLSQPIFVVSVYIAPLIELVKVDRWRVFQIPSSWCICPNGTSYFQLAEVRFNFGSSRRAIFLPIQLWVFYLY